MFVNIRLEMFKQFLLVRNLNLFQRRNWASVAKSVSSNGCAFC